MGLPILYILMRNDLTSMNPGKAIAQGSHASNAFVKHIEHHTQNLNSQSNVSVQDQQIIKSFREWEYSTTQGFGTVIVLESSYKDILPRVEMFKNLGYITGIVHDPTYPILDGSVVHHIPLDTCGYVFVPDKETDISAKILLCSFSLHK